MNQEQASLPLTLQQIATLVNGRLHGNPKREVVALNSLADASANDLTFFASKKFEALATKSIAPKLVTEGLEQLLDGDYIVVREAYVAFATIAKILFEKPFLEVGSIHPTAVIHHSALLDPTAAIGPGCVVGRNTVIGKNVQLVANVVLYANCTIGDNSLLHANVVCYSGTQIGQHCIIHAGAVLGSDGFGYIEQENKSYQKIPQVGTVRIGDNVEIGANTTIDRAALGSTVLEEGVKLDNLVHIAHGVQIGENTAIAAQAGISGSTHVGKRNRIAGQVGVVGHITIADDVTVYAQSGVAKEIDESGTYFGSPAREARTTMRIEAALRQLPDLLYTVRELTKHIEELKKSTS